MFIFIDKQTARKMKKNIFISLFLIGLLYSTSFAQVNFTSSNLPIIVINTNGQTIVDEPKIIADMGIVFNGEGNRNYVTDEFNDYNGKIGIEIRGSSSQQFPKNSYAVETRDENDEDISVSLLGLPEEEDWVLYAPYSDKTLIRNALIYGLSNDMGVYASRTRFVEVVLNDEYLGVYVLMEKIKRDKNRIDIKKLEPDENSGIDLTGGYIIKIDKEDGAATQGWYSQFVPFTGAWQRVYYQYHYPKEEDISETQVEYIQEFIYNFESKMRMYNYTDSFEGYYDIIDLDSFADYVFLNEFSRNVDAYRLSTFLYKDRDDKNPLLKMGPIWDFNLAFGNCEYYETWKADGLQLKYAIPDDYFQKPFWWEKLYDDPIFANKVIKRWNEVKSNKFSKERVNFIIDSLTTLLSEAAPRNFERWNVIGTYVWPNYFIGESYQAEIEYLKNWVLERWNWFNNFYSEDYSNAEWKDANEVVVKINVSETKTILASEFYSSSANIDSLSLEGNNSALTTTAKGNNEFEISSSTDGNYKIRFVGWRNNNRVEISPAYSVNVGVTSVDDEVLNTNFALEQNYPNPFNPTTRIKYQVASIGRVSLKVYDILGREVITLLNKPMQPGNYEVGFNGSDLPSGVYFYKLTSGQYSQSRKMLLLK